MLQNVIFSTMLNVNSLVSDDIQQSWRVCKSTGTSFIVEHVLHSNRAKKSTHKAHSVTIHLGLKMLIFKLTYLHPFSLPSFIKKLRGLSPPRTIPTERPPLVDVVSANFSDRECHVVSVTEFYGRILGFLDRSRYFFF
jgi:hypothetical protein